MTLSLFASSYQMPIAPYLQGVGVKNRLPAPCWDCLAWAGTAVVHLVIIALSWYMQLPCCVWKTTIPWNCPPPIILIIFLTPHYSKISDPIWFMFYQNTLCYQPPVYNSETGLRRSIGCKQNIKEWENNLDFK